MSKVFDDLKESMEEFIAMEKRYYGMTIDEAYKIVAKMIDGSYTNQDYDDALDAIHDFIAEHKGKTEEDDAQAKLYHDWLTEVDDE